MSAGGGITLSQADSITFDELTATEVSLTSGGDITIIGTATIDGSSSFESTSDGTISLTDSNNTFGTLTLTGGVIEVVEAGDVELSEVNASTSFTLTAGGNVTDVLGSSLTSAVTTIDATGDLTLGDVDSDDVRFDTIDIVAQNIILGERDSVLIENLSGQSLELTAIGDIEQTATSAVDIVDAVTLDAGTGNILLENTGNSFGSIEVLSAADVSLLDSTDTPILGIDALTRLRWSPVDRSPMTRM
ncbi:MAG: hypothetical protein U5O39_19055 [Gammaproteobacteria bacterium]|nr:hypothetical protein [Gammaproteobacteria bacterium]